MGSFNVACSLSGIPIVSGERTGVQIIAPNEYSTSEGLHIKPTELYNLFLSPLYGEYNSYGLLESIESNSSCKILEDFFNLPIETILRIIVEVRDVYDSCGELYKNYQTKKEIFEAYDKPLLEVLLSLGFILVENSEDSEGLETESNLEDQVTLNYRDTEVVVRDNTLTSVYKNGKMLEGLNVYKNMMNSTQMSIYSKITGIYPGVDDENVEKIKILSNFKITFFNPIVAHEMNVFALKNAFSYFYDTFNENLKKYDEIHGQFLKMLSKKSEDMDKKSDRDLTLIWEKYNLLNTLLKDISYNSEDTLTPMLRMTSDDVKEVTGLYRAMSYCNRVFMPSFYVSEDDPYKSSLRLNKITKEILKNRKLKYKDF